MNGSPTCVHGTGRDQHFRHENLVGGEAVADLLHGRDHIVAKQLHDVRARVNALLHQFHYERAVALTGALASKRASFKLITKFRSNGRAGEVDSWPNVLQIKEMVLGLAARSHPVSAVHHVAIDYVM